MTLLWAIPLATSGRNSNPGWEVIKGWLENHPWLTLYFLCLFVGSLISFTVLTSRAIRDRRLDQRSLKPWLIRPLDFTIFISVLVMWAVSAGVVVNEVMTKWLGEDGATVWATLVGGLLMQLGMAYVFLKFRFHLQTADEGPLSPRILSTMASMRLGFFYFLASLPVIWLIGICWGVLLQLVQRLGVPWEPTAQDAVLLFREMDNLYMLIAMVVLAVVVAPFVEELVFRGGVFRFLKGRLPHWLAILISSILFGMVHANFQSLAGLIAVGVCLCLAYELTGNLKVPMFFHGFFNLNTLILLLVLPESML